MPDWFDKLLLAFIPLFVAIDPIGALPLFLGISPGIDAERRRRVINHLVVIYVSTEDGGDGEESLRRVHRETLGGGGGKGSSGKPVFPSPSGFHCEVTSPGFDEFANGQSQTVAGVVSPFEYVGTQAVAVASVAINGIGTTLGTTPDSCGYLAFTTVTPVPVATDGSSTPISAVVCLTNGTCIKLPLAVLEGYEILAKVYSSQEQIADVLYYTRIPNMDAPCTPMNSWINTTSPTTEYGYLLSGSYQFNAPGTFTSLNLTYMTKGADATGPGVGATSSIVTNDYSVGPAILPDNLGLAFGFDNEMQTDIAFTNIEQLTSYGDTTFASGNSITFRAPQKYKNADGSPTTVLFTFEGVQYGVGHVDPGMDLSQVVFTFGGQNYSPISQTNGNLSYLIPLQGGTAYTLNQGNFTWPAGTPSCTVTTVLGDVIHTFSNNIDWLSFSGFHNEVPRPFSDNFWVAYTPVNYVSIPDNQHSKVWDLVGGSIGELYGPTDENTCATRMSRGLDYGGAPIIKFPGAGVNLADHTYNNVAGDKKRYIVSANQMSQYLTKNWGSPDFAQVSSPAAIANIVLGLKPNQCAIFATRVAHGHTGVLKSGYQDPHLSWEITDNNAPVDVWVLPPPSH